MNKKKKPVKKKITFKKAVKKELGAALKRRKSKKVLVITKVDRKRKIVTFSHVTEETQKRMEFVLSLTLQTAALELAKQEYIEMSPLPGMCGPFRLSGNSLPVIEYRVFDPRKKPFMMEFIKVRVEVSKPDRIHYIATIDSHGSQDAARHGEEVPVLDKYREPFEKLSGYLRNYFPFYRNPMIDRHPNRWDKPKVNL